MGFYIGYVWTAFLEQASVHRASSSSRGLGHLPFTEVTGVRIPVGTPSHYMNTRIRVFMYTRIQVCRLGVRTAKFVGLDQFIHTDSKMI